MPKISQLKTYFNCDFIRSVHRGWFPGPKPNLGDKNYEDGREVETVLTG
jgi:hypothetical protein